MQRLEPVIMVSETCDEFIDVTNTTVPCLSKLLLGDRITLWNQSHIIEINNHVEVKFCVNNFLQVLALTDKDMSSPICQWVEEELREQLYVKLLSIQYLSPI